MTDDTLELYRAIRDALRAGVRATAIKSALNAVLIDECSELEAAMVLRRLAKSKPTRQGAR
jgi:hypothetical protein